MTSTRTLSFLAFFFLVAQYFFWSGIHINKDNVLWSGTKNIKPELEIVPAVPSREMLKAFSFGDEELTFRYYGYMMQFLGDTFGRITPLRNYDYEKLYRWWTVLDEIDSVSDLIVYVVGYYYAATQDEMQDLPYVVDFLEHHSDKHPTLKWWWYSQAVYNAKHKLHDNARALKIAKKLSDLPKDIDIPIWARQLQAFIYEDEGQYKQACDIIVDVLRDYGDNKLTEGEMNYIYYFIQERLRAMIEKESSISKADLSPECLEMMKVQKAKDLKAKANQLK